MGSAYGNKLSRLLAALLVTGVVVAAAMLVAASDLPPHQDRTASYALMTEESRDTTLGRGIAPLMEQHPGASGGAADGLA